MFLCGYVRIAEKSLVTYCSTVEPQSLRLETSVEIVAHPPGTSKRRVVDLSSALPMHVSCSSQGLSP